MGVNSSQLHVIVMLNICLHGISGDKYVYYDCYNKLTTFCVYYESLINGDVFRPALSALVSWDGLTQSFINKNKQDCSLVSGQLMMGKVCLLNGLQITRFRPKNISKFFHLLTRNKHRMCPCLLNKEFWYLYMEHTGPLLYLNVESVKWWIMIGTCMVS